jgi:hypothetical protein
VGEAEELGVQVETQEAILGERRARYEARAAGLEALEDARLEEQRLLRRARQEEARRGQATAPLHTPLLISEDQRVVAISSPFAVLPWISLAALFLAFVAAAVTEMQDRTFHVSAEVTQRVELPVLGVIPHLRRRF